MMEFEYVEYKDIQFPVRRCEWNWAEDRMRSVSRIVGSDIMCSILCPDGTASDDEAAFIDSRVSYYIPHDMLVSATDEEILDYIAANIDEKVADVFG